jgi:hypothetical protein
MERMGKRRRFLVAGLVALGLAACKAGIPLEQVRAWEGRPAADLVREWGPPTKEVDDAGQRVLVYEEVERTVSAAFTREVSTRSNWGGGGGIAPPPSSTIGYNSYARSYLFWVDATGKISRTQIHNP